MSLGLDKQQQQQQQQRQQQQQQTSVIVVGAPASGSGKTTVTCGLIAAYAARGLSVRCCKAGPDFLDGMQHRAALEAGRRMAKREGAKGGKTSNEDDTDSSTANTTRSKRRRLATRTANLDGWMQGGSPDAVRATFLRHLYDDDDDDDDDEADENTNGNAQSSPTPPDVCIVEGVMGLHDARDGLSDDGSTAQIAKILDAPVLLVVDAGKCARSAAATVLGHAAFDAGVRVEGAVANFVAGSGRDGAHVTWIRQAVEQMAARQSNGVRFFGGLPREGECAIPERHLGLHMPETDTEQAKEETQARFERLVRLMEDNLDLDGILDMGRSCPISMPKERLHLSAALMPPPGGPRCRIGIAEDAAFCFYYSDNLHLLVQAGAELVPFSPLRDQRLPPELDGLYIGGGYPELHAEDLEKNVPMRQDIKSFCDSGATVFAECGGFMYLADQICIGGKATKGSNGDEVVRRPYQMCGVFPGLVTRMTKGCTMFYASIEIRQNCPVFGGFGDADKNDSPVICRGQEFHYSEVAKEEDIEFGGEFPVIITAERPGAKPKPGGYAYRNTFASYLHIFFASKSNDRDGQRNAVGAASLADDFVRSAIRNSPR